MSEYVLSCCSTADLTRDYFEKRNIKFAAFNFALDGVEYKDDLGKTVSYKEFYEKVGNGAETKTSQINAEEYSEYFEQFLKEGKDVLHLTTSSGISGTINSAMIAKGELSEKYPDRKLIIVDSLAASSGYGLFMDTLADMRDEGKTIEEVAAWAEENRRKMHHWFFSTDLSCFIRGGRISKTAGTFGMLLNICPLLNVDLNGKLVPRMKVRTKRKVIEEIVRKMEENADNGYDYSGKCFISHSVMDEDTAIVAKMIEEKFPKLNGKVEIFPIGTTIGSHTGPGTVALFFWGTERID